jgi:ribosomal protein S4
MAAIIKPRYKKYRRDSNYWSSRRKVLPTWNQKNIELWDNLAWRKSWQRFPRARNNNWKLKYKNKQDLKAFFGGLSEKAFQKVNKKNRWNNVQLASRFESRLDSIIYRSNWAYSRFSARQLISHGHFMVNGKQVRTSSYMLKPGDVVEISWNKKSRQEIKKVLISKLKRILEVSSLVFGGRPHFRGGRPNLQGKLEYWIVTPNNLEVDFLNMAVYYLGDTSPMKFYRYHPIQSYKYWKIS